jgi:hypothetical protein
MHIEPGQLEEARRILAFWAPGIPAYAYGSRAHGRGLKATSDLDLCLRRPHHPLAIGAAEQRGDQLARS